MDLQLRYGILGKSYVGPAVLPAEDNCDQHHGGYFDSSRAASCAACLWRNSSRRYSMGCLDGRFRGYRRSNRVPKNMAALEHLRGAWIDCRTA